MKESSDFKVISNSGKGETRDQEKQFCPHFSRGAREENRDRRALHLGGVTAACWGDDKGRRGVIVRSG